MLKIRAPNHAPSKLVCQYKPGVHESQAQEQPKAEPKAQPKEAPLKMSSMSNKPEKAPKYSARFVKESFPDKFKVNPGEGFTKTWTMRNDGETAWPANCRFIQTNGDDLSSSDRVLYEDLVVAPGQEYNWVVKMTAPAKAGQYCSYFRMAFEQNGNLVRFGHKVWCNILVEEPAKIEPVKVEEAKAEPVVMNTNPALNMSEYVLVDKSGERPVLEEQPKDEPKDLAVSSVFKAPKEIYMEALEAEQDEALKAGLRTLYDFGFVEFKINKALLQKYKNDTNTVAEVILQGALNESTFQKLFAEE